MRVYLLPALPSMPYVRMAKGRVVDEAWPNLDESGPLRTTSAAQDTARESRLAHARQTSVLACRVSMENVVDRCDLTLQQQHFIRTYMQWVAGDFRPPKRDYKSILLMYDVRTWYMVHVASFPTGPA